MRLCKIIPTKVYIFKNKHLHLQSKTIKMKKTTKTTKTTKSESTKVTNKVTKHNLVKAHLIKFKHITSLEAIEKYSATRLSAIIFKLRKSGFSIATKDIVIKDRFGNNCTYGKYVLLSTPNK